MITVNDPALEQAPAPEFVFDPFTSGFEEWPELSIDKRLERLVFRVARAPKSLRAHVQRIHYCFGHYMNEQLAGALIDLLIVLEQAGFELRRRMIFGARSRLTDSQFQTLRAALNDPRFAADSLPGNRFSLFLKGLGSSRALVEILPEESEVEHDALQLARDYIEYSQLDEAVQVLETALLKHPERIELHDELLALLRSTRDRAAFQRVYDELSRLDAQLPPAWAELQAVLKD